MTAKERKGKGSPSPLGVRMQMKETGSVGVSRKLLLLLGAFAVGLFAWWSRGLCEMALSLWGASSPALGAVVVCFWLLCLTALLGTLVVVVSRTAGRSGHDASEYQSIMDELTLVQSMVNRLSTEVPRGSGRSTKSRKKKR